MAKKTQSFQAEIQQLLNLMIHSLYSQKEIFLRELISNSSDALDKLKFNSLTDSSIAMDDLHIRISADKENKNLKIIDNGIGMDFEEVENNIGTIAKSGTKEFLKTASGMKKEDLQSNPELIGQFGVGFYSSFMVANKVTLHTQKHGETDGVLWESDGSGSYTIERVPRPEGRGTTITLALKEAEDEDSKSDFTEEWTLKSLIKKYSDFIAWPVKMKSVSMVAKKDAEGKDIEGETETVVEDQTVNSQKALWTKPASEVSKDEYNEFYKHLSHDWNEPCRTIHFKAEGTMEFNALMYLPSQKPFDFGMTDKKWGLSLYIKRVFIMDNCEDLIPSYLRFVTGLVDSSDLSLNVSREMLQQDRQVTAIKKSITSKILNELGSFLKADRPGFEKFWDSFGITIKEGIPSDAGNKDKVAKISLFRSTFSDGLTTLDEYVERMPEGQNDIFFLSGENLDIIKTSPYLEKLKEKGLEVLYMTDPIDEWFVSHLTTYADKKLLSITSENLDLDSEDEKKKNEEKKQELVQKYAPLIDRLKVSLKNEVKDVRISDRLKESPVCLVSAANDPSANFERIMNQLGQQDVTSKRILEINAEHPVFGKMLLAPEETQKTWGEVLFGQALLAEGSVLPDPVKFSRHVSDLMELAGEKYQQ